MLALAAACLSLAVVDVNANTVAWTNGTSVSTARYKDNGSLVFSRTVPSWIPRGIAKTVARRGVSTAPIVLVNTGC